MWSFEENVRQCVLQMETLEKWSVEKTQSTARALLDALWWWSVGHSAERINKARQPLLIPSFMLLNLCRWSFDCLPGEDVVIRTRVRRCIMTDYEEFFLRSASLIARRLRVDIRSLRIGMSANHPQ